MVPASKMVKSLLSGPVRLRDTLSRELVEFRPPGVVRMYVCGMTVYDYAHIGHARTFVVFDVLYRLLKAKGFDVRYVQNFTDVDDKIIDRARELGVSPRELAERFIQETLEDFERLNLARPSLMPRATHHIQDMIDIISGLISKGYAYKTATGVYFDVSKFPGYGKLSRVKSEDLRAGARVEPDPSKRNPADFALWKFFGDEPSWDSPWGRGRPGWHIECSAMVLKHLGGEIEIHGGGADLIFPHHENEIAQTESLTGAPVAKAWVHVGLLNLREVKMAKSIGNVIRIRDAISWWGLNTLRLYLLSNHYRSPLEVNLEGLRKAYENWRLIESAAYELVDNVPQSDSEDPQARKLLVEFDSALSNDLNTPPAIKTLVKTSRYINRLSATGKLRGSSKELKHVFDTMMYIIGLRLPEITEEERVEVERLVTERSRYRREKRFREADEIRERLRRMGVELIDLPGGTKWRKVERPDFSKLP